MKRLFLSLLLVGAVAATAAASESAGASTTRTVIDVDVAFSDSSLCGFHLDFAIAGRFHVTDFFDPSGTLVKEMSEGPTKWTVTNPANGKTARSLQTFNQVIAFAGDGSVTSVTQSGHIFNWVMPGAGSLAMDVGTLRFDDEGNLLFVHGPHDFLVGDLTRFCAALTDP